MRPSDTWKVTYGEWGKVVNRPSEHTYFMKMAVLVSTRSTCLRRQYGAIIVKDGMVVSTGYNGSVKGAKHCEELGCLREELGIPSGERYELCRSVHAEANAIIQAAQNGVAIKNSVLYVNGVPCQMCARLIINAGIKEVYIPGVQWVEYHKDSVKQFEDSTVALYVLP